MQESRLLFFLCFPLWWLDELSRVIVMVDEFIVGVGSDAATSSRSPDSDDLATPPGTGSRQPGRRPHLEERACEDRRTDEMSRTSGSSHYAEFHY